MVFDKNKAPVHHHRMEEGGGNKDMEVSGLLHLVRGDMVQILTNPPICSEVRCHDK